MDRFDVLVFETAAISQFVWPPWRGRAQKAMLASTRALFQACPTCKLTYSPRTVADTSERKVRDALRHRGCGDCKQRALCRSDRNWHTLQVTHRTFIRLSVPRIDGEGISMMSRRAA